MIVWLCYYDTPNTPMGPIKAVFSTEEAAKLWCRTRSIWDMHSPKWEGFWQYTSMEVDGQIPSL